MAFTIRGGSDPALESRATRPREPDEAENLMKAEQSCLESGENTMRTAKRFETPAAGIQDDEDDAGN